MPLIHDVPTAFSDRECDSIVALGERAGLAPATVWAGAGDTVDRSVRSALTSHHPRGAATAWIYDRLDRLFAEAGRAFAIAVGPIAEPLQILRYEEGGHFRAWHSDAGYDATDRRLVSVSVELSDPGNHEGGILEIIPDTVGRPRTLERGGARFFPS
ncbi:MAG TPA: hypothetical protein VF619_02680, partial [Allosphingosinicella sp.]